MRDEVFRTSERVRDFIFDGAVARVFDDMLERSVPFYWEVQRMVVEIAARSLGAGDVVYDIGCSTGNTLFGLATAIEPERNVRFVGIEPSPAMRERARHKLAEIPTPERVEILPHEVHEMDELPDARVITMLYTLQFIRPLHRLDAVKMCHESLRPRGCLILAEKILADNVELRRLFIDLYHDCKRRHGYSSSEITRKREALENVLVPFTSSENQTLLRDAGFAVVEPIFRWYNFEVYLAVKD